MNMNPATKNKALTWLVIILLIANAATIATFWLGKAKHPPQPKGTPMDFLTKELNLDAKQQDQLKLLVKDHRAAAEEFRVKIKEAKDAFFDLLKEPAVPDSLKKAAAAAVSSNTEQLDLLTLNHFQKVRALCTPEQQKKFDSLIRQVTEMMAPPRPMGPGGPPPGGPDGMRPPPQQQ